MKSLALRLIWPLVALVIIALLVYGFWPVPFEVDSTVAVEGRLVISVADDGITRIRERYTVSSPVAGRLMRVELQPGDPVVKGETILAVITPTDAALLDPRARQEAEARVRAAEAAVLQAQAAFQRAGNQREIARHRFERIELAAQKGAVTGQDFDEAEHGLQIAEADLRFSEFGLDVAGFELDLAKAAVRRTLPGTSDLSLDEQIEITAPTSGTVLRIAQESAAVIAPGTRILEIGDPSELEMVIDVLSSDAINIRPGTSVIVETWGGEKPLAGTVRLVEPSAFMKISALGIEEQRVNVVADFTSPLSERETLGDGFRIEARIVTSVAENAVKVHQGSLFREGDLWYVFRIADGKARQQRVVPGRSNGREVEILEGVSRDDVLILYPTDKIQDEVRVLARS